LRRKKNAEERQVSELGRPKSREGTWRKQEEYRKPKTSTALATTFVLPCREPLVMAQFLTSTLKKAGDINANFQSFVRRGQATSLCRLPALSRC